MMFVSTWIMPGSQFKRGHLNNDNPIKRQIVHDFDAAEGRAVVVLDVDQTHLASTMNGEVISKPSVLQSLPSPSANQQKCLKTHVGGQVHVAVADNGEALPGELSQLICPEQSRPSAQVVDDNGSQVKHAIMQSPPSPSANRQKFLNGFMPARSCCNLDFCRVPSDSKINVSGICMAVFPPTKNPDRRYIQICDDTGSTGITVWNSNVAKFNSDCVGKLVTCVKVAISSYNGKRLLTMTRESSIQILDDDNHHVMKWWKSLLHAKPKTCGAVHDVPDGSIVTVTGILGLVNQEIKMVNGQEKYLTYLHMVDASGRFDVRSWNHSADMFLGFKERPVCIKRLKITSFVGSKIGELLDGDASVFITEFPGSAELEQFWAS
jgi:hypothetical protein